MPMTPHERVPYSAIVDRPPLPLPDGARMIVWVIVNVENWDIRRPMPRALLPPPMGNPLVPDLPNWAWHEYGMRVGFWRLLDCLKNLGVVPTLALNGSVCEAYPRVAEAARSEGWEFMGHGWVQGPMHALEDQRASIRRTVKAIGEFAGKAPRGWESPGLTETLETIDVLAEEGIEYVADWIMDDQPCEIKTTSRPVLALPYTAEVNDVPLMTVARHEAGEMLKLGKRQFDRLYGESEKTTRIMSISVHPYLSGVPHRIGLVEELLTYVQGKPGVLLWTGERILDWYRSVAR